MSPNSYLNTVILKIIVHSNNWATGMKICRKKGLQITVCNFGDFYEFGRAEARTTQICCILNIIIYLYTNFFNTKIQSETGFEPGTLRSEV